MDEFLLAVGKVSGNATAIDLIMLNVFRMFSGLQRDVARAIYYAIDAHQARQSIIKRVMAALHCDDEEKQLATAIMDAVTKVNKQRNELSHATLSIEGEADSNFIRISPKQSESLKKSVSKEYLASVLAPTGQSMVIALDLWERLCKKRGASPQLLL